MLDDWRDRRIARLEHDLTSLRGEMWNLDTQVDRRFREREREHEWQERERARRRLDFMLWVLVALMWATVGATIAVVAINGG